MEPLFPILPLRACKNNESHFSSGIEEQPTVFYRIIRGSTDQTNKYDTFYLQQRKEGQYTYADIKVNHPLDYERIKEYNLTVRVEVIFRFQFIFGIALSEKELKLSQNWVKTETNQSQNQSQKVKVPNANFKQFLAEQRMQL